MSHGANNECEDNENRWERLAYFELDRQTATKVIARWTNRAVAELDLMPNGRRNSNYRVALVGTSSRYLLRVYADGGNGWIVERAATELLRGSVPVPMCHFAAFEPALLERPVAVYDFVEGQSLDSILSTSTPPPVDLVATIGQCLAKIHSRAYDRVGFLDEHLDLATNLPPFREWYDMFLGERAVMRLGAQLASRVRDYVVQHATVVDEIADDITFVHGDFRPQNILAAPRALLAIIDWEGAMAGHRYEI